MVANAFSAKKPKQKKAKVPESSSESDSDDEPVLPPKKKGKNLTTPYMKIKIYKDSPKALESIMLCTPSKTMNKMGKKHRVPERRFQPRQAQPQCNGPAPSA